MSSIREQALQAIKAALASDGTPAATITRAQLDQIQQVSLPCYDVVPGDEKVEDQGVFGDHQSVTRSLTVMVRAVVDAGTAEGEDGDTSVQVDDSALDDFYAFAIQKLIGNGANLNGLVENVREVSATPVFRPEGRDIIGLEMNFEVTFATKRGDPTQKG